MDNKKLNNVLDNLDTIDKFTEKRMDKLEKKYGKKGTLLLFSILVLLLVLTGVFWNGLVSSGAKSAKAHFEYSKEVSKQNAYDKTYSAAYDKAIKKYQATNDVYITVGNIKEVSNLQVLSVLERVLVTQTDEEKAGGIFGIGSIEYWIIYEGYGIYTINMQVSEFIIDNSRHYVLARIPRPELTINMDANSESVKLQTAKINDQLASNLYRSATVRAYNQLAEKIDNGEYYRNAENEAKEQVKKLIERLNSDVSDLAVEVKFLDE